MGEVVTVPKNIVVKEPLADKVNKDHVRFYWDAAAPYAVIYYQIQDDTGRDLEEEFIKLEGADFTAFVADIGNTIKTRSEAAIWTDLQAKYTVQNK
jgi:hypothetical protein